MSFEVIKLTGVALWVLGFAVLPFDYEFAAILIVLGLLLFTLGIVHTFTRTN